MSEGDYIVAATKPWSMEAYSEFCEALPNWHLLNRREDLSLDVLDRISPRYIFFPHWNWIVPNEILKKYECVCFHMTDVPYGRGGSPLQNLIARGHKETKLTALRMTDVLDAGPVYSKKTLSLHGSAQEIYTRAAYQIMELAFNISQVRPTPKEQIGEITTFRRRKPSESKITQNMNVEQLYDFIRMLDADTYPRAFLEFGGYRFEFDGAKLVSPGEVEARVYIKERDE